MNLKKLKFMSVDVTSDCAVDQIVVRTNLDNPNGRTLELLVVTQDNDNHYAGMIIPGHHPHREIFRESRSLTFTVWGWRGFPPPS